jgi:uncharacterized protein YbdZ (MbtH family)
MPEQPNGWSSAPSPEQQWYAVDLGKPMTVTRAEIAFFADGKRFDIPRSYRIQVLAPAGWRDVGGEAAPALANGITNAHWPAMQGRQFRISLTQRPGKATRLVEFKLFTPDQ